jgi:UTP-glucose-1-phosphate uridylyltransferase
MQVIIPLAGKGTRLRPHTHLVPKPLLKVAGRPVMDWVMDRLDGLEVSELIFITGHLKEQVEAYARARYTIPSRFIEQKVQDGTAGAVNLARPFVHEPVLIIFVDTVFEADLTLINRSDADGIIWAKEVEDYQRFGVVVTDAQGYMTKIVEKPDTPVSKLANIGLILPDRCVPVDDRPRQAHPHRRSGRMVRLRRARHAAGDQRDAAQEGRGPAGGLPRRDDPRSGVHRGRRHHRARRDRSQRFPGAGDPDHRQ